MPVTRPLPWLVRGYHHVDLLSTLGHRVTQAAINFVACAWGSSDVPDRKIHNVLIPNEYVFRHLGEMDSLPAASLIPASLHFAALEPSSRPVPMMTPHDLTGWWTSLIKRTYCKITPSSALVNRPELLVRAGYAFLREDYFESPDDSHELGACLSMIGTGALAIFTSHTCNLCRLRRSVGGSLRCLTCSRSKKVIDSNDMRPRAAEASRIRRIRTNGYLMNFPHSKDLVASYTRSIASLLFSMHGNSLAYLKWRSDVNAALAKSPAVTNLLGAGFTEGDFQYQTQILREIIDENEWDYGLWPEKILQAQSWNEAADVVQQRRRGPGPMVKTIDLAHQAQELLNQGKSKKEIAMALGVSLSHLSHILRRTSQLS